MAVQDNQIKTTINEYFFKNRADFEAHKNEILNNSNFYIEDDGLGVVTMQTKVLWTNPNPTSSFAAQDVAINDLSDYDYFVIISNDSTSGGYQLTNIQKVLDRSMGTVENWNIINNASYFRSFEQNQNTLKFKDTRILNNSSGDNSINIPYQIIGIKLIESPTQITNKYSTDETVVGEWIDGKKIYRKVVDMGTNFTIPTTPTTITGSNLPLISEVGTIINVKALLYENDVCITCDPCQLAKSGSNWTLMALDGWNGTSTRHVYIIMEYTKTTD